MPRFVQISATLSGIASTGSASQTPLTAALVFEPASGNASIAREFSARGRGFRIRLTPGGFSFTRGNLSSRLTFAHSCRTCVLEGTDPTGGSSSYFHGASHRRIGVPHFRKLTARNVWPGIDLIYYSHRNFEYDLILKPGAEIGRVKLIWEGAELPRLNTAGELEAGPVRMRPPRVYQDVVGVRRAVRAGYRLNGRRIGFEVAAYDRSEPLVIDPELEFSLLAGGAEIDNVSSMVLDSGGNIILTGRTESPDFPASASVPFPSYKNDTGITRGDAFVLKLNPAGDTVLFSTFLGGSRSDSGVGIALNSAGAIIVAGSTTSADFPVTPGAVQSGYGGGTANDAFVAALSPDGSQLRFATYVGGNGGDTVAGVATGPDDAIHILMNTNNPAYPVTPGAFSRTSGATAMVVKLAPDGTSIRFAASLGLGGYFLGIASAPVGGGRPLPSTDLDTRSSVASPCRRPQACRAPLGHTRPGMLAEPMLSCSA